MAKRPTVEVDEDYLKEIMAGGITGMKKEMIRSAQKQPKPEVKEISETEEKAEKTPEPEGKEPVKQVRKKRETQDYESVFLERRASEDRQQIYISYRIFKKIMEFLPLIAGHGFNITAYVNNILSQHLEKYQDEINELYEKKIQKPF